MIRLFSLTLTIGGLYAAPQAAQQIWRQAETDATNLRAAFEQELRATRVNETYALLKGPVTPSRAALVDAAARAAGAERAYSAFQPKYTALFQKACRELGAIDAKRWGACDVSPIAKAFGIYSRYYAALRSVFEYLGSNSGAFQYANQSFVFASPSGTKTYNALLDKLSALQSEGESMQQQGLAALQRIQAETAAR
jgi:hypothetical protein